MKQHSDAEQPSFFLLKPFCLMRYKNPLDDVQFTHVYCLYKYLNVSLDVARTLESKDIKTCEDVEMLCARSKLTLGGFALIHNLEMLCMNLLYPWLCVCLLHGSVENVYT